MLEQQRFQTKERLQLSELQLETLNNQLEEQTEALRHLHFLLLLFFNLSFYLLKLLLCLFLLRL
jgi:hypothetical protein